MINEKNMILAELNESKTTEENITKKLALMQHLQELIELEQNYVSEKQPTKSDIINELAKANGIPVKTIKLNQDRESNDLNGRFCLYTKEQNTRD